MGWLERGVRYDRSMLQRIAGAWYGQQGLAAWHDGGIPHAVTQSASAPAEVVALLSAAVRAHGTPAADGPLAILEVGSGLGHLAAGALERAESVPELAGRLVWQLTDRDASLAEAAAASERLAPWWRAGRVIPSALDLASPVSHGADPGGPLLAVVASYVACATPVRYLRSDGAGQWSECWVTVEGPDGADTETLARTPGAFSELDLTFEWREMVSSERPGPFHRALLAPLLDGGRPATVAYPERFVDFLRAVGPRLVPGGLVILTDVGFADPLDALGRQEPAGTVYGNTLNHAINFALLDGLVAAGWGVHRVADPVDYLQRAVLAPGGAVPATVRAALDAGAAERTRRRDLLDLYELAVECAGRGEDERALRLFERCIRLDPTAPGLRREAAAVALEAGFPGAAVRHLEIALALPGPGRALLDFDQGRVFGALGLSELAIPRLEASATLAPCVEVFTNLAELHLDQGDVPAARSCVARALALAPTDKHALALDRALA